MFTSSEFKQRFLSHALCIFFQEALSRLNEENGSLSKSLEALNAIGHASRNESLRSLASNSNVLKVIFSLSIYSSEFYW